MRVEKHVLSILYQSGEARDSSGMRYIKLQGCLEFYNSIMATDFHTKLPNDTSSYDPVKHRQAAATSSHVVTSFIFGRVLNFNYKSLNI